MQVFLLPFVVLCLIDIIHHMLYNSGYQLKTTQQGGLTDAIY